MVFVGSVVKVLLVGVNIVNGLFFFSVVIKLVDLIVVISVENMLLFVVVLIIFLCLFLV